MDLPTEHFVTHDLSYVSDYKKFMKGVVVFESSVASDATSTADGPPSTGTRLIQLGSLYVSAADAPRCHICKLPGHLRTACPEKQAALKCRNCGEQGHVKRDCPQTTCNNCGAQGHRQQDCPEPVQKGRRRKRRCLNCDSSDHPTSQCSEPCGNCGSTEHIFVDCMPGSTAAKSAVNAEVDLDYKEAAGTGKDTRGTLPKEPEEDDDTLPQGPADPIAPSTASGDHAGDAASQGSDSDTAMGEPHGTLHLPSENQLTVQFVTQVVESHITSCNIKFTISYEDETTGSGRAHKTALVRFTSANVDGTVNAEVVDQDSPTVQNLLSAEMRKDLRRILPQDSTTLQLYHVQLAFAPSESKSDARVLLGEYFFTDSDLGPYTEQIHHARDMLMSCPRVVVHFFTLGSEWITDHIDQVNTSLGAQKQCNPLLNWWKRGTINVQKGQQLPAGERPSYQIPARYQFDNPVEYFTVHFYGAITGLESINHNPRLPTVARLVSFYGGGDRVYYAAIQMTPGFNPHADSILDVGLLGEDSDTVSDWKAIVIESVPFGSGYEYPCFLFRPRVGTKFASDPHIERTHVLDGRNFATAVDMREALFTWPGIHCQVREHLPKVGISREINTLRHLFQAKGSFPIERQLVMSNNFVDLPRINYFDPDIAKYGAATVDSVLSPIMESLSEEQKQAIPALRHMTGGILLIQGPGGVGKSTLAAELIKYHYRLGTLQQDPGRIWVISPLNRQLDMLARNINATLMDEYNALRSQGKTPKYPMVMRRYMRISEYKMFMRDAAAKRAAILGKLPEYVNDNEDGDEEDSANKEDDEVTADVARLCMDLLLYRRFKASNAQGFDSRLKVEELSEGQWVLRLAGVPDENGELHPIADPDTAKYSEFRTLLHRFSMGEDMTMDEKRSITILSNEIIADLAKMADVILMTPDVLSQARAHTVSTARALIHDEAGKASELSSLAGLVWTRPYTTQGGLKVEGGDPVPKLFLGDIYQPKPTLGPDVNVSFREQKSVSLYARLLAAGADTIWFWQQHRFVEDIACLVNAVLPHGQLRTDPNVKDRETSKLAARFFKEQLKCDRTVAFLSTESEMQVNECTQSTYNIAHARRSYFIAMMLLEFGVEPANIGLAVPYTAQLVVYTAGLQALEEWCYDQKSDSKFRQLAPKISEIQVFTVDGIQGGEVEFLVYDTTVAGPLKFVRDTARNLLAITRARAGLIIIGNVPAVENHYGKDWRYTSSAYYKIAKWCKENKVFINLERTKKKEYFDQFNAPFQISNTLELVHRQREPDQDPISYSGDTDFDISVPDFAKKPNDKTGNGSGGWDSGEVQGKGKGKDWGSGWGGGDVQDNGKGWDSSEVQDNGKGWDNGEGPSKGKGKGKDWGSGWGGGDVQDNGKGWDNSEGLDNGEGQTKW